MIDGSAQGPLLDAIAILRLARPSEPGDHAAVEEHIRRCLVDYEDPAELVEGVAAIGRFAAHLLAMAYDVTDDQAIDVIYQQLVKVIAESAE